MLERVKVLFWNNGVLKPVINCCSWFKNYVFFQLKFILNKKQRINRNSNNEYKKIQVFKNKHLGERCFILATGPSLTKEDVRRLKYEYTFGMNSICLLFSELGWETTYYGVQDLGVFRKLVDKYQDFKNTVFFVGDGIPDLERKKTKSIPFAINYLDHKFSYKQLNTKFSLDVLKQVYDGYTITYSLIQIAVYMGFKEIYLLGNDCSYPKEVEKQHFMDFGHYDSSTLTARERILYAYQYAKDFLADSDVKIFNATRGGALEIFPRVDFDSLTFKTE